MSMQTAFADIVKKYGESRDMAYVLSSGSFKLDDALGVNGYPSGRMIEIFGDEGSGKTTLGLMAMAQGQALGFPVAIIDAEYAFNLDYAHALGLEGKPNADFGHMLPDDGEQAVSMVEDLIREGVKVIVVDSVSALIPRAELKGEPGEAFMGLQARMMGQACRRLIGVVAKADTTLIWINQTRLKIGQFFGSPVTTSGGRALRFYSSVRLRLRAVKANEIGHRIVVKVEKNKLAPPFRVVELPLRYGLGVDVYDEFFEMATEKGLIKTGGTSWYFFEDKKFNGKDKLLEHLRKTYAKSKITALYKKVQLPPRKSVTKRR